APAERSGSLGCRATRASSDSGKEPGALLPPFLLEGRNGVLVLQGQADVVQTVEQDVLARGLDLEGDDRAVGLGDALLLQVHHQAVTFARLGFLEEHIDRKSTRLN